MLVFQLGIFAKHIYGKELEVHVVFDGGEDFVDGAGGVDEGEVEFFGDFGVGGVDFLLEGGRFGFESLGGFAPVSLAREANCVGDGENEAVVGVDVFVGEH